MFKVLVLLLAIVAVVYSVPAPPNQSQLAAGEGPRSQASPAVDASVKAVNGEIDPKNEKEELEGAEFGWGGWGYPSYRRYYNYYPNYYYPSYPSYSYYHNWW